MQQLTLARQAEFQRYTKKTRREQFLEEMEAVMPWAELQALAEPHYSKGETGRKPVGLGIMLRVYFLQQWFALSDPGVEDALYESAVMRRFAGIDLGRAPAPDETTILNFRHLLEEHELCGQMLDAVNLYLASRGIRITTGSRVAIGRIGGKQRRGMQGVAPVTCQRRQPPRSVILQRKVDRSDVWNVRTHLINILGCGFCETGIAQGVSAQMNGWPLGTDRRAVGIG